MSRHKPTQSWYEDWDELDDPDDRHDFLVAYNKFCQDLEQGGNFREELAVREVQGAPGIFQMKWGEKCYATFSYDYGDLDDQGRPRLIWRRLGKV